jgi:hypothetical protein
VDRQLLELVLRTRSVNEMAAKVSMTSSGVHKRLSKMLARADVKNQRELSAWLYGVEEAR